MKHKLFTLAVFLAACGLAHAGSSQVGGKLSPDSTEEIQVDLPGDQQMKNKSGTDGSGLCVFTSMEIAGHWQNVEELRGFQEKMTKEEGGGWPDKVDQMMKKYAPNTQYVQYSGSDPSIIKLALKTGRMVGVTYGYSPRYKGKISHMVDCVHYTDKWAAVLDNNFPGEDQYEWMAPDEFLSRWKQGSGGWVIVLLSGNPPPPIPINRDAQPSPLVPAPLAPKPCPGPRPWPMCSADQLAGPSDEYKPDAQAKDDCCCQCSSGCTCCCKCKCKEKRKKCCKDCPCAACGLAQDLDLHIHIRRPHQPRPKPVYQSAIHNPQSAIEDDEPDWTLQLQLIFRLDFWSRHQNPPTGVDQDKMPQAEEHYYSYNGTQITALEAFRLVQGSTVVDDTNKQRLTLIGQSDVIAQVQRDLNTNPELLTFKDRLLINSYANDSWAVKGVGLGQQQGSTITIVLQSSPDSRGRGRVLHVQHDYQDGARGLATAIRRADPSYDPFRDADLRKEAPKPDCPDPTDPTPYVVHSETSCPVWATLLSVIFVVLRLFVPDLYAGGKYVVGYIKIHANAELEKLKAELAALKQQKPAA